MTSIDLILGPIYAFLLLVLGLIIRNRRYRNKEDRQYFMTALALKMFGAVMLGVLYQFYYSYGDTYSYFHAAQAVSNTFIKDPGTALNFIIGRYDAVDISRIKDNISNIHGAYVFRGAQEIMTVRVTAVFAILGLGTYLSTALLFAFASFLGQWALYRTFLHFYPNIRKQLFLAVFLLPSIVFWGSGILKDTITLGCISFITYGAFKIFLTRRLSFGLGLLMALSVFLVATIKGYILILFLPAMTLWVVNSYKGRIKSAFLRRIVGPFFLAAALGLGFLSVTQLGGVFGRYQIDNLEGVATATQQWHTVANVEGSVYSLPETDFTFTGLLRVFPAAVNVALFRPWPWEVRGPVMALMGLESMLFLGLTIIAFLKIRGVGLKYAFSDPFINFCLLFSLLFAFAVGFTSYNFGALGRYKIPMMPYFLAGLFMMRSYLLKKETERKSAAIRRNEQISELAN